MKNIICLFGVLCLLTISGQFTDVAVAARDCDQWLIHAENEHQYARCIERQSLDMGDIRDCDQWLIHAENEHQYSRCIERQSLDMGDIRDCDQWLIHAENEHQYARCTERQSLDMDR